MSGRVKKLLLRQRGVLGRLKFVLESILVVAGTGALVVGIWHQFDSQGPTALPGEGKRVVAFRQLANRICTENRHNQRRAETQHGFKVVRLGFAAQALRWNLGDLEGITAPPTRFDPFVAEVKVRAQARRQLLALRDAIESGNTDAEDASIAGLRSLEGKSRELSREASIVRCMRILPPIAKLLRPTDTEARRVDPPKGRRREGRDRSGLSRASADLR